MNCPAVSQISLITWKVLKDIRIKLISLHSYASFLFSQYNLLGGKEKKKKDRKKKKEKSKKKKERKRRIIVYIFITLRKARKYNTY